jgi:MFS family permease
MRSTEDPAPPARTRAFGSAYRVVRRGGQAASRRLVVASGGPTRARIVLVLGSVLALSSADTATVGAAAVQLRHALHIGNTDIGLLVAVTAGVGAVFSVPFGVLADRARRTWILGGAIVVWAVAMIWGATASSFSQLLWDRVWLGAVTAATAPVVASLVGDWIPGSERGKIYGYILTGELVGAGIGFAVTGDIAALSWRAAFVILALPAARACWARNRATGRNRPRPPAPSRRPSRCAARRRTSRASTATRKASRTGPPMLSGWLRRQASSPIPA